MSDVPEYIIEAERVFTYWAFNSPVSCMEASKDKSAEDKYNIFQSELQYHLGAFYAAESTCNSLYHIEGFDRCYPEHFPPWMDEAVEYQRELLETMEDS